MRAALLLALWLPPVSFASGIGVPASDFGEVETAVVEQAATQDAPALADKSPEQLHAPVLVFDEPVPTPAPSQEEPDEEGQRTEKRGMKLSVPLGAGAGGSSSSGRPQRTGPGSSNNPPPSNSPPPTYGGPGDNTDSSTAHQFTASASPCSRDGYHNTAMKKGIDLAHRNCQLHQLDKNRRALWGLAGGDPVKHWVMEKQLDKALDVFKVK